MNKIIAQILHYNQSKLIIDVIQAIEKQTYQIEDIIIIDNGSDEHELKILSEAINGKYTILTLKNEGVGKGHNEGWRFIIKNCKPTFIWVIEHDAIPYPDCLEKLINEYQRLNDENNLIFAAHPLENSGLNFKDNNYYAFSNWKIKKVIDNSTLDSYYGGLSFNGLLLPVSTINKIGFLDEDLFVGYEDVDYIRRIQSKNGKILKVKGAIVHHNLFKNRKEVKLGNNIFLLANESIKRAYYSTRNRLYIDYFKIGKTPNYYKYWFKLLISIVLIAIFKDNKMNRIKYKYIAFNDAKNCNLGEIYFKEIDK
jgi:GT2 family glycosyltransferase